MTEDQIVLLKKTLQQQQEQINALSKRKRMRTWERYLIYPVLVVVILHLMAFEWYFM